MERPNDEYFSWLVQALWKAYRDARKGKRHTFDQQKFEANAAENIYNLALSVYYETYKPSRGIAFITMIPVIREIFAAPFRDRVIHHFLFNVTIDYWEKHLIYDSYSCREGKGTHFGARRLQGKMQTVSENYTKEAYVIKMDIRAFFMSLNRKMLLKQILKGLDDQFKKDKGKLYKTCKFLWTEVILDDPVKGVERRGKLSRWFIIPPEKSLFHRPKGIGIVIGNLTSQLASNIFLDQLDRFVTETLGYKYYGRYVDDFYIVVPAEDREKVLRDVKVIRRYLRLLGLTLHKDKLYIQEVHKGVDFVGAKIYPRQITPGRRIKKNYKKITYDFASGHATTEQVTTYFGMMKNFSSHKFEQEVFEKLGWDWR